MREKFSGSMIRVAIAVAAASAAISAPTIRASAQAPAASGTTPATSPSPKTPWGEPDLQGIWTDETATPLQRPTRYANQDVFTEAERAELDRVRSEVLGRDRRAERGTERDVSGSYNNVFVSFKRTGARTSLIADPPNGRIPPLTPEAQKFAGAEREFRLALLRSTETCKNKEAACSGGTYDPTRSPRFADPPPRYNTTRMNRNDGPEDSSLAERCLTGGLPEFGGPTGSFRRIVQTPGGISIFYDVGQGQGWQRNIVMDASPHLPANIRQWYGDSRGHWEGNTLVIDVTNFSPKTDFQGARENLPPRPIFRAPARACISSSAGPVPGRARSNMKSRSKIRRCGRGHGRSGKSSPGRATRTTDSIPSRVASRETTVSLGSFTDGAWKSAPLRTDEVLIRQPGTP